MHLQEVESKEEVILITFSTFKHINVSKAFVMDSLLKCTFKPVFIKAIQYELDIITP